MQRDPHLREDDATECVAQVVDALDELRRKRAARLVGQHFAQRDQGPCHHAEERIEQRPAGFLAHRLHLRGMHTEPFGESIPDVVGTLRHFVDHPLRQRSARARNDLRHLGQQRRETAGIAPEEHDGAGDGRGDRAYDDCRHQQDDDELRTLVRKPPADPGREQMDELVDQEAGKQRRQQMQQQDQDECRAGENPRRVHAGGGSSASERHPGPPRTVSGSSAEPRLQARRPQLVVDLERLVDPRIVGQVVDVEVGLGDRARLPPQHRGLAAP